MNPRLAAARALAVVLNGKASLGSSLPPLLDKVEQRDRGLAQDLAFGTARWQPRLALIAEKLLQKPFKAVDRDVEALLLIGLYQLFYTRIPAHAAIGETVACVDKLKKPSLKGLLNAVLRNAQREHESLLAELDRDPVLHTAHPRWLQKALKAQWPEHWEAICAANNAHPPLILRVNRHLGSKLVTASQPVIHGLIGKGEVIANELKAGIVDKARAQMAQTLQQDLDRLEALKAVNPNVRDSELDYLRNLQAELHHLIDQTQLKLDAIRFIVVTHN